MARPRSAGAGTTTARRSATVQSKDRATSSVAARRAVLKRIKDEGIEHVLFWFTDLEGHLKSFAITPNEMEGALNDGMGFDGSSITGFNRIEESDMVAIPDPATFEIMPRSPTITMRSIPKSSRSLCTAGMKVRLSAVLPSCTDTATGHPRASVISP